jgi:hypothetical protein
MKITQILKEAAQISAAFAFGRFNPAHQGHIEVWRTVQDAATNWYIGTNPSTLGPNDPLTFEQKSAWMSEIYPPITGHIAAEQSVMTLAAKIFADLGKNEAAGIAYITDADDWAWSGKLLNQYNGVQGAHGYYKFAEIVHVVSPRVSSATALRDAARADDKVAFYQASGTDPKSKVAGLTYFDTVKQAVEKYPLPVKRVKKVKEQGMAEGLDEAVGGNYLYHATGADGLKGILSSGSIRSATAPQAATSAQTKLPTVSVTRDWGYASGSNAGNQMAGIGRHAVLVLDRNAIESNFKTLGTSQSNNFKGLALNPYLQNRSQNTDPMARANAKAKAKYAEPTTKAGGEFEEVVVVPKGALPLKGTLVGFWINPKSELMKDPAIMNDPRRLDMVRPNQFVKATQQQGVTEDESGMFSKVMSHETSPEAAKQIQQQGFKKSRTGIFFNVEGQNYSGGGYGGNVVMAKVSGPIDDILNLEDDNDLPDDLDDFADGEEIADYARSEGYWAWTDGVQFAVLDPRHIQVVKQGVAEGSLEEVSQQTLQSYRKKASAQKRAADDVVSGDADDETWKKNVSLSAKRRQGIDAANKRLGVAEGAPIVVAQAPINIRNPKKAPQTYRNKGDIVPPTTPPSTEKRGVKGRPGQRPMPKYDVEEASLATMRDYFAGDENAKDPTKLSQMRDFFNKHKPEGRVVDKRFNSKSSYEAWLTQQKMKQIGGVKEDEVKFTDYELAVAEGGHNLPEAEKIAGRYDPEEFDSMVQRLGKIAKAGPMKTVWDPKKRVYKTVPDTDKQKKIAEAVIKVVEVIKQRNGLWKK